MKHRAITRIVPRKIIIKDSYPISKVISVSIQSKMQPCIDTTLYEDVVRSHIGDFYYTMMPYDAAMLVSFSAFLWDSMVQIRVTHFTK